MIRALVAIAIVSTTPRVSAEPKPAKADSKPEDKPSPKITSVTPASVLLDDTDVEVTLRGMHFVAKPATTDVRYETATSQGIKRCTTSNITETELTCKLDKAELRAMAGEEIKFSIAWTKGNDVAVGALSSATFIARTALLATEICVARPTDGSDLQTRIRVAGATAKSVVKVVAGGLTTTCGSVQLIGTSDVVCYLPREIATQLVGGLQVQVLREGERATPKWNNTSAAARLDARPKAVTCVALARGIAPPPPPPPKS